MTATIKQQIERRQRRPTTFEGVFAAELAAADRAAQRLSFPCERYQQSPQRFAEEVLGVRLWTRQIEILNAVRDHRRVAVASGRKIGKDFCAAVLILWFFCSFPGAVVVMTARTARQVQKILWKQVRMLIRGAKYNIVEGAEVFESAQAGVRRNADFAEITGTTAADPVAMQGVSGVNLLYVIDEASGVGDPIFHAIEGNAAAGARVLAIGNPTRTVGEFFSAFGPKSQFWHTIQISSKETPNYIKGRAVFPGLASREWIEQKKEEWGEDSALFAVHVEGKFALNETGRIHSLESLEAAIARHDETPAQGRLFMGVDPAGPGEQGDESMFCARRGYHVLGFHGFRRLSAEDHLERLLEIIRQYGNRDEGAAPPVVIVDATGQPSKGVYDCIAEFARAKPGFFEVFPIFYSAKPPRDASTYKNMRAVLPASLARWFAEGGSIPNDRKLVEELHASEWSQDVRGWMWPTLKEDIRDSLGRSPDRADALALCCWEPASTAIQISPSDDADLTARAMTGRLDRLDPYRAMDAWSGRGAEPWNDE